ncbi:MAG: GlcG/HbpS family heme-binding protein [Candidatus Rariloculaceae bacterium]
MAGALTPLKVALGLEKAEEIIDAALRLAREHQMLPLTVTVLDSGGHQIALKREDGCGIIRVQVAIAKAYGALGMGVSSRVIGQRLAERPVFSTALTVISEGNFASVPGGVLICDDDGTAIGAVGISGETSARDEFAAIGGIKAVGYQSEPAEVLQNWND